MNTCKACKWWRRGGNIVWEHGIFGNLPTEKGEILGDQERGRVICTSDQASKTGICLNPKIQSDYVSDWLNQIHEHEVNDGIVSSCDEQRANLQVGENFGCIHHCEKKLGDN